MTKVAIRNTFTEITPETKTTSFPIMRLPYVALQEVLKHMDLIELIELSFCSRKCIQLVKIARRNKRLCLRLVGIHGHLMMYIENEFFKSCFLCVYENNKHEIGINLHDGMINGHKVKYCRDEGRYLKTYWEDQMTGKVEIFKYITDLFQYPRIICASIHEQIPIRPLYDWIAQKYDGRIDEWDISGMDRSQENIQYLADICRKGKIVNYTASFTQQHRFDLNFDTDHLSLRYVKWLNLDDMIKLSNQSVILQFDGTSLTNQNINGFLKNWIQTTHSTKMKYIFMRAGSYYDYDIHIISTGIEHKASEPLPDHPFKEVDFCHSLRTKTGFTIQRNNGELASIFFSLDYSTSFEMIIH